MRHILLTSISTIASACVAQAALPADVDRAFATYTAIPATLVPILEKVADNESAQATAPALREELVKLYKVRSELEKIHSLSDEVKTELLAKYEMDMRREWGKVYEQIFRLQKAKCYGAVNFYREFQILCMMLEK